MMVLMAAMLVVMGLLLECLLVLLCDGGCRGR